MPIMRRTLTLMQILAIGLFAALPAFGQKYLPKTIQFKGAPEYSDQELLKASGLKKGEALDSAAMNETSKRLLDTGIFETVAFKFDGQDLIYTVTPSAQLYPIRLENLPLQSGKELDDELHQRFPLYHGKVPAEGGLTDGVSGALEEMLAAQGMKSTIAATAVNDSKLHGIAAMSFSIAAPAVQIGEIRLDGASAPLDPKAAEILAKLSGSPYDTMGSPSQIATYLGNFFRDKGYLEADIRAVPQGAPSVTAEAIRIPFQLSVAPGAQYKLSGVRLAPGMLVTQAEFDRQSGIHPGDVADGQRVTENWEFLARQYHNRGYMKAAIVPTPTFDRTRNMVSFDVTADPGPVYTMGALTVVNVSDDLRAAILAAWSMPRGAVFNEGSIRGFFATTNVHPALERVFATIKFSYILRVNDDAQTVDVELHLEKKH